MSNLIPFTQPLPPRLPTLEGHVDDREFQRQLQRLDFLLLARNARAAAFLAATFREKSARKLYWALVVGAPRPATGRVDLALAKVPDSRGERVAAGTEEGRRATTLYATVEAAAKRAAWLVLWPLTGRTHQLRVHCAQGLGTPIVGDFKYGGAGAEIAGAGLASRLHLHARSIEVAHPAGGRLRVRAELPDHMRAAWAFFGFDPAADPDPFPVE